MYFYLNKKDVRRYELTFTRVLTRWRRGNVHAFEPSNMGLIPDPTVNRVIVPSEAGCCITNCTSPPMDVKLGVS